jgi:hypothetical protein
VCVCVRACVRVCVCVCVCVVECVAEKCVFASVNEWTKGCRGVSVSLPATVHYYMAGAGGGYQTSTCVGRAFGLGATPRPAQLFCG